jgi:hypothetical protein
MQESYFRVAPPQSRFEGSRRQYRGKVLRILRAQSTVSLAVLARQLKKPAAWTRALAAELEQERLVEIRNGSVSLPKKN